MDLDGLRRCILSNQARYSQHSFQRSGERILDWTLVRASFVSGYELVEDYPYAQPNPKALLLPHMADKRPLHTVWAWDGVNYTLLVTAYQPDNPAHRQQWTNGFRQRRMPPQP